VLGNDATANINVLSTSALDFLVKITGLVNAKIDCKNEVYVLVGDTITLMGLTNPDNCIAKGLK
jgi:hypothetical protein